MALPIHLSIDEKRRNVLLDALRRKLQQIRYILNNKDKYGSYTLQKAKEDLIVVEDLLKILGWKEGKKAEFEVKKEPSLEERIRKLELAVDNLKIIVKKLVAFHKGEIE